MNSGRLIFGSLRAAARYKLRSTLMMVGSLIGVTALTLVLSIGSGVEQKMLKTVGQLFNANTLMITSSGGMILSGPREQGARLTLDDLKAISAEVPNIDVWDPVQAIGSVQVRHRDATTTARVLGLSERSERVWARGVSRGEYFDAAAVSQSARVALLGKTAARELFGAADPLEAEILIGQVQFRVIGVLEAFGTDAHGMDRDAEIVVPISTMMRRVLNVDTLRGAKVLVKNSAEISATAREVRQVLRDRHGLGPGQPDDFLIMTPVEVQGMVARMRQVLGVFLPLAGCLALLAGAVVTAGLMLFSIKERTVEIGLRRAVGARPRDIAWQFLVEAATITIVGGIGGIAVGTLGAVLLASKFGLPEFLSFRALAVGLLLSLLSGLMAGVLPARRAALLQPADALRS